MRLATRHGIASAVCLIAGVLVLSVAANQAAGQAKAEPEPVIVLDTFGFWRVHHTLKPQVIQSSRRAKPVLMVQPWLNVETPEPPDDWTAPEFDDGAWIRCPLPKACRTSYLSRLCLRGKFRVTDPAKVRGLTLSVNYHGGVRVTVNGQEVARAHLAPGAKGRSELAEGYPEEMFVTDKGGLLVTQGYYVVGHSKSGKPSAESERRMARRQRRLQDVAIPSRLLRPGINVVAIEVIRSPYHQVLERLKHPPSKSSYNIRGQYDFTWNTCQVNHVRLTAGGAEGLVPNATRPEGFQVWNSNALMADYDLDYGDPCETLQPIVLVGARNGIYSGKVVVGSTGPIRALQAVPSDLKGPAGSIPACQVRVRYGMPWGSQAGIGWLYGQPYPRSTDQLEAIADEPLEEFPVRTKGARTAERAIRPEPVFGAVVPVWVTVAVPPDARPGSYTGQVTLRATGEPPVNVPVDLKVVDWTLPDREAQRTWIDMIQSPDTLAVEYDVPLWSEAHWRLIARSFDLMGEVGNKTLYVPLICHTNLGNAESMVRWIDKGPDRFDFDFSVMERYLDTALAHMGRPERVILNVWDVYLIPKADGLTDDQAVAAGRRKRHTRMAINLEAHKGRYGVGPMITVVDPSNGTTENVYLPTYCETPLSKTYWGALFAGLRDRMGKRGLDQGLLLGMLTDAWPSKQEVAFFKDIAPGVPWMIHSHDGHPPRQLLHGITPVAYQAQVWGVRFADSTPYKYQPVEGPMYGWKREGLFALFERFPATDTFPAAKWRSTGEYVITGDRRGIGRLGADFWNVIRGRRDRRVGRVPARFPEAHWSNLNVCTSLLAPGPKGPASTNRFEHFREGVQECEARILIERALTDDALKARLGPALAARCQKTLDERLILMWKGLSSLQLNGREFGYGTAWRWTAGVDGHRWFAGSGWQTRSEALYRLAGDVARKLGDL